jgi:hypothetical protein
MQTADQLFAAAFNTPRDARSPEYKAGVLAALHRRIDGVRAPNPYPLGTAAADAFWAGVDEGYRIYRTAVASAEA